MDSSHNNSQNEKLTAYLKKIKRGPGVKANAIGGRGIKDASKDTDLVLKALKENWNTLQNRLNEMPEDEKQNLRELLNTNVEGMDDFGDWVFTGEQDDFERTAMDWSEPSRESVRELLIQTQFIIFE